MHTKLAWWKESDGDSGGLFFRLERLVTNGVPQERCCIPCFVIYINNINALMVTLRMAPRLVVRWTLRRLSKIITDLDQLGKCVKEWQMEINSNECELMLFGKLKQNRSIRQGLGESRKTERPGCTDT